ncbi:vancomycin resistance protein YoaR [Herbinix hemicellulosilytica]|uniref:Putative secreted protein n=1 Tax=Herbinix hemicellulosilytica TaxID=1564487 RepID=A0A0H5SKL8_HERHM|nr:VanW family protein [Herbinix hemicellulosilytica]RBP59216.1 vancomycin resistance protein YoaR [Herbinix hemicellulosilytica]CRZ35341.1 putative secreted protein [Herbinix hemicellulosilytica]
MSKRLVMCCIVLVLSGFMACTRSIFFAFAADDNRIIKGVFIDEVDVGGMTAEEAEKEVIKFVEELKNKKVSIQANDQSVSATLGDLGYTYKINNIIETALGLGKTGNLIKRYKDIKDIENEGIKLPLEFVLDENKVREFVSSKSDIFNVEPVNASVSRKNGQMIYTDHIPGKKLDVEATVLNIVDLISNSWDRNDLTVEAFLEDVEPVYTRDIVEKCNTILGTFTTEYADSSESRAKNLANGARLINNTVVYPGEVFSAYEHLAPFTRQNGYHVAGAYSKGKVIDSIGGGACQVTTTLYNAVLYAELEVVQRHEHSMTISYVDLSRDAAIAGTYKDFKFKNNTDVPILIEAYTKGRTITFNIWGHETRDTKNRKIKFETRVLSKTAPPPDVIEEDPTKPVTYKKVTQAAHTGYKAELYKIVYENGVEVSRTLVNKSTYAPAPRYITVGTKEVEEDKNKSDSDNKNGKNTQTDNREDSSSVDDQTEDSINSNINQDTQQQIINDNIYWDPEWDDEGPEDE